MLSAWLFAAALAVLPVILILWAEDDNPGNHVVHHQEGDPLDTGDDDGDGVLLAA
jgi:hypothetical protein